MFGDGAHILRGALRSVAGLGVAAVALAGCGDDSSSDGLASLAPPDTPFYLEGVIRPEGDRAEAISSITETVAGIDDPGERITSLLDQELAGADAPITYAEDIEPWLGEKAASFVRSLEPSALAEGMPDVAVIVETTDSEAAQGFIDKAAEADSEATAEEASYENVDYVVADDVAYGLVDDFLVVGTESSFKAAVDASVGESLGESDPFAEHAGELDDDQLASMWLDLGIALDAAGASADKADRIEIDAARAALGPLLEEPVALSLAATPKAVTLDSSAAGSTGVAGDTDLLGALPAEAWFALAVDDAGTALRETLAGLGSLGSQLGDPSIDPEAIGSAFNAATGLDLDRDVLSWVGSASGYVAGTSPTEFAGGVILSTSAPEASAHAIEAARGEFEERAGRTVGPPRLEGADDGFAALGPTGQGIEVALRDDEVVAALGGANPAGEALEPSETLAGSDSFDVAVDALTDDFAASAYVALQDFFVVAEQGGQATDPDYLAARPYLDALDYLIFGTATDDERELSRIVVGLAE